MKFSFDRKYMSLFQRLFVAVATGLVGCASVDELVADPVTDGSSVDMQGVNAGFFLVVGDNAASASGYASRVPQSPEGGYDPGSGYENFIDILGRNFRFMFFDEAQRYLGQFNVSDVDMVSESGNATSKRYQVLGQIDEDVVTGRMVTVVALANWPAYPSMAKGDPIAKVWNDQASCFTFGPESMMPSAEHPVPLYGVRRYNVDDLKFDPYGFTSLGTIHLLRAYAKVCVECQSDDWTLRRVTMTRYNTVGRCAPEDVRDVDDYVHNSYAQDYVGTPHLVAGAPVGTDLSFAADDRGGYTVYVPEFAIKSAEAEQRARIAVEFDESVAVYYIDFKYYVNPPEGVEQYAPFDILRNYWYQFSINKVSEWGDLKLEIDVQPYASVDLQPDFGFLRDDDGNIIDAAGNIIWTRK
ncbi:MAG: hypothetical protein K2L49_07335 [Muribaculaceae bacterium]|nr:hypothetical protein [Muribaculaceae bacterium]